MTCDTPMLTPRDFTAYFDACHGCAPFPWQSKLLDRALAGGWPETVSLPTASGKTAVLDVAVFALACRACGATPRAMPRRIALVVDRRIVVDDAFARARRIRDALAHAETGILKRVADALRSLGGETALDVAELRGGMYREDRWARTPAQPVILCSTVDQVGSRLLHRGYGLSSSMWPIHAGLLGNDCMIVLDEAHCSEPFRQTLEWVGKLRARAEKPLLSPFAVVTMTATPRVGDAPFILGADDYANPTLRRRIEARKRAKLETAGRNDADFVRKTLQCLSEFAHPGTATLIVVNRVGTARAIREALRKDKTKTALLLTGRCRPLERDELLRQRSDRIMAGRSRAAAKDALPLVIVATQCVEVGADLDADALITECSALDALRQRFGRLDRLGELDDVEGVRAAILIRDEQIGTENEPKDDPIYGQALSRTWHWLQSRKAPDGTVDMGIAALDGTPAAPGVLPADPRLRSAVLAPLTAPTADAPVMFPAYCDLWAQTGPEPAVSPDPAIFLHGPERGEPTVRIVWRGDLGDDPETWRKTVSLCPPVSSEALPLPIGLARKWLAGLTDEANAGADIETSRSSQRDGERGGMADGFLPALCWRGPQQSRVARAGGDIRPGDVLVVPASRGGCDREGWNPGNRSGIVPDIADAARFNARRCAVLRVHRGLALPESLQPLAERTEQQVAEADDLLEIVREALAGARACDSVAGQLADLLLQAGRNMRIVPHPSGVGVVLACDRRPPGGHDLDFSDEDDAAAHAGGDIALIEHLTDVDEMARAFVAAVALPDGVAADVALAARWHDLGKADPRFQAWLSGGSRLSMRRTLLAKSARMPTDSAAMTAARERAGYPRGGRHELLSVRLAESAPALLDRANDHDLVLHLVESHHGHCRCFAPAVLDDAPLSVTVPPDVAGETLNFSGVTGLERLDSGVADRFWKLTRRYGWWGLSYLETCLRLADHRASERPSRITGEPT